MVEGEMAAFNLLGLPRSGTRGSTSPITNDTFAQGDLIHFRRLPAARKVDVVTCLK